MQAKDDMNQDNRQVRADHFTASYYNKECGEYHVISAITKDDLNKKVMKFEQKHDMSCWLPVPDLFPCGISLPRIRGFVKPCQKEGETLLSCKYPFPDRTKIKFVGRSVSEIRRQIIDTLYKKYPSMPWTTRYNSLMELSTDNLEQICSYDTEKPQFKLDDYTVVNYINKYIDDLHVYTGTELAIMVNCGKSTISRIKTGETQNYDRDLMLRIGVALKLPKVDLIQFMRCVTPLFPKTIVDNKVLSLIGSGITDYQTIRETLINELGISDF